MFRLAEDLEFAPKVMRFKPVHNSYYSFALVITKGTYKLVSGSERFPYLGFRTLSTEKNYLVNYIILLYVSGLLN